MPSWHEEFSAAYAAGALLEELTHRFFGYLPEVDRYQACVDTITDMTTRGYLAPRGADGVSLVRQAPPSAAKLEWAAGIYARDLGDTLAVVDAHPLQPIAGRVDWLVIGDTHYPFVRGDDLARICERYAGRRLILSGDLFTFAHFSIKHAAHGPHEDPRAILRASAAFVGTLAPYFPEILVLPGNHDLRLPRFLSARIGPDWETIGEYLYDLIFAPYPHIHVVRAGLAQEGCPRDVTLQGYMRIGDTVISHLNFTGKPVNAGAMKACQFVKDHLPEDWRQTRLLLHSHTHKSSYSEYEGVHVYEVGAMSYTEDYVGIHHNFGPVQSGYVTLSQEDGRTLEHGLQRLAPPARQVVYRVPTYEGVFPSPAITENPLALAGV